MVPLGSVQVQVRVLMNDMCVFCSLLLDGERWRQADVPAEIQSLVCRLESGEWSIEGGSLVPRLLRGPPRAWVQG